MTSIYLKIVVGNMAQWVKVVGTRLELRTQMLVVSKILFFIFKVCFLSLAEKFYLETC